MPRLETSGLRRMKEGQGKRLGYLKRCCQFDRWKMLNTAEKVKIIT